MIGFNSRQSKSSNSPDGTSQNSGANNIPSGLETGAILRERREAMGVTLEEAEAALRIRQKYLSAMESDEWDLLPGEIVGRGFLRNYAGYLDLEPTEMLERRRSAIEPRLAAALRSTSAGSALPPARAVDYNPKELDLKDEPEGIEGTAFSFRGLLPIIFALLLAYVIWQGLDLIQGAANAVSTGVQNRIEEFRQTPEPTQIVDSGDSGDSGGSQAIVADLLTPATDDDTTGTGGASVESNSATSSDTIENPSVNTDSSNGQTGNTEGDSALQSEPTPIPPTPEPPTPEPTPIPPTPEPPTPIPPTPEPLPTPEPPTAAPLVVAPSCPDGRSIITAPGEGQTVSGIVEVAGSATHEAFQFYKLEYAPGANASGGWAYFDGGQSAVAQGRLGSLDSQSLANGVYSLRLVVVDLSANFPPPCQVTITVQN